MNFANEAFDIAYGLSSNGTSPMWISVGYSDSGDDTVFSIDNTGIMYSHDGISWSLCTGSSFHKDSGQQAEFGTTENGTSPMWIAIGKQSVVDPGYTSFSRVKYSFDGISWSDSRDGLFFGVDGPHGVAYGVSTDMLTPMWVIAGKHTNDNNEGNRNLLYSYNGISWSESTGTSFSQHGGKSVAFGTSSDGTPVWVSVGYDDRVLSENFGTIKFSYDGISWSDSHSGVSFTNHGEGVAFGTSSDGTPMWVAMGIDLADNDDNFGHIIYSFDGISWSDSTGMSFITDGNAGHDVGGKLSYYNYGVSRVKAGVHAPGFGPTPPTPPPPPLLPVFWVAGGNDVDAYGALMFSYDGISWSDSHSGTNFSGQPQNAAYGTSSDGTSPFWVLVGDNSAGFGNIKYSYNGISWSDSRGLSWRSGYGRNVSYGLSSNGTSPMWVAFGQDGDSDNGHIKYSYDGISWSNSTGISFGVNGGGVAFGTSLNGTSPMWVGTGTGDGSGPAKIMYSYDGISWSDSGDEFGAVGGKVAYGVSTNMETPMWVIVGDDLPGGTDFGNIKYSYDGISWSDSRNGNKFSTLGNGVAFGMSSNGIDPMWVAVGDDEATFDIAVVNDAFSGYTMSGDDRKGALSGATNPVVTINVGDTVNFNVTASGHPFYIKSELSPGGDSNNQVTNPVAAVQGTTSGTNSWTPAEEGIFFYQCGIHSNMNGQIIVVAGDSENIMYSYDGISWSNSSSSGMSFNSGVGVAYGLSTDRTTPMWIALGDNGTGSSYGNIMYSFDGISWSDSGPTGTSFSGSGGAAGYALDYYNYGVSRVKAGLLPPPPPPPPPPPILPAQWVTAGDNFTFVGVSANATNNLMFGYAGTSWLEDSTGTSFNVISNGVAWGEQSDGTSLWVSVGEVTSGSDFKEIQYSFDGVSWSNAHTIEGLSFNPGTRSWGNAVAYGTSSDGISPMWIAVGAGGGDTTNLIKYSYDGISWSNSISGPTLVRSGTAGTSIHDVAFGVSSNGTSPMWVACTGDYNAQSGTNENFTEVTIIFSFDGLNWSEADGSTATPDPKGITSSAHSVTFGTSSNGTSPMWVVGGYMNSIGSNGNKLMSSTDGRFWTPSEGNVIGDVSSFGIISAAAFGTSSNGTSPMWMVGGNLIYGKSVTQGAGPTSNNPPGSAYKNIMYSYDGISWSSSRQFGSSLIHVHDIAYGSDNSGTSVWVAVGRKNAYDFELPPYTSRVRVPPNPQYETGNIIYSYNGVSWSDVTEGTSFRVTGKSIAYKKLLTGVTTIKNA